MRGILEALAAELKIHGQSGPNAALTELFALAILLDVI
jgi:hypothetical protein